MDFLKDAAAKVSDMVGDVAGQAAGAGLKVVMKAGVENVLTVMGPKTGELVAQKMKEKYPALDKIPEVGEKAKGSAENAVKNKRDMVMAFVDDLKDDWEGGFTKVGSMLLKTTRSAVDDTVTDVLKLVPQTCGSCCPLPSPDELREEIFQTVSTDMKNLLKDKITSGMPLPGPLKQKLDDSFDKFDVNMDVGQPTSAPTPQTMGAAAEEAQAAPEAQS